MSLLGRWASSATGEIKSRWEVHLKGLKQNRNSISCLEKRQEHSEIFYPKNSSLPSKIFPGILKKLSSLKQKQKAQQLRTSA